MFFSDKYVKVLLYILNNNKRDVLHSKNICQRSINQKMHHNNFKRNKTYSNYVTELFITKLSLLCCIKKEFINIKIGFLHLSECRYDLNRMETHQYLSRLMSHWYSWFAEILKWF